jgi:fluoroacetyl-CoA thioesterase
LSALEPGAKRSDEFEVGGRLLTDVGGTLGRQVLSTPGMIAMMERNAAMLARDIEERKLRFDVEVSEGERTIGVGTHERRVVERG